MAKEVIMPKLGLTMKQGTITEWLKREGDTVSKDETICRIETDKISSDVESTADGIILKILVQEGESADVTMPICLIGSSDESISPSPESQQQISPDSGNALSRIFITPAAKNFAKQNGIDYMSVSGKRPDVRIVKADILAAVADAPKVKITPVAKVFAEQNDIDYTTIKGSGPNGRIIKDDILAQIPVRDEQGLIRSEKPILPAAQEWRRVPMTNMRKAISSRMAYSKQHIPHVYFKSELDISALVKLKNMLSETAAKYNKIKITYNDLIIKATALALSELEVMNAYVEDDDIVYADGVHLSMAVSIQDGLVAPVLKNADRFSLVQLSESARRLTEKAKTGKLQFEEISGGTFTVSNLGSYGIDSFAGIITPNQSGVLAVGAIKEKVIAVDGEPAVCPVLEMTLSVDHRLVDGAVAASFLTRLKAILSEPMVLLL